MNLWDKLVVALTGKRIGILGAPVVGKTVLHRFLREGVVVTTYEATMRPERQEGARPRLETKNAGEDRSRLAIRKGRDVPGSSRRALADWKRVVGESDILLYL